MKQQTVNGFDVYSNGTFLGFVQGRSKRVRVAVARHLVTSTHMATWHILNGGDDLKCFEYNTTIGVYLLFEPCKRLADTVSNYSIPGLEVSK